MKSKAKPEKIRVGLMVHDPMRRAGLSSILSGLPHLDPIQGEIDELLADHSIRFIVLDVGKVEGDDAHGVDVIRRIHAARPELHQIVLGNADDELVIDAILAGARAFLETDATSLTVNKAFQEVEEGTIWARRIVLSKAIDRLQKSQATGSPAEANHAMAARLTAREQQVIELILQARSNREIAAHLGIEERTVKAHLGHLMRKVGVSNRIELSLWALKQEKSGIKVR
jgi:DNA-binding NarL/FixJ family response regulator